MSKPEAIPIPVELREDDPTSLLAARINEELENADYVDVIAVPRMMRVGPDNMNAIATCGVVLLVVRNNLEAPEA